MRGILISPNDSIRTRFAALADRACQRILSLGRVLNAYPAEETLSRMIRAVAPEIVFLDIENQVSAETLSRHIAREFPGVQQIAIHISQKPEIFRFALKLRMRDLLSPPFDPEELLDLLDAVEKELAVAPPKIGSTDRMLAFLPAKPGVGASTVAANLTWALSKLPDTRVLLMDCDMSSGVCSFLFNVQPEYSLLDAVKCSDDLDENLWHRVVKTIENIDLLPSIAPGVADPLLHQQMSYVLDFARRNYSVINVDLPDALDDLTLTMLREANRIFLTTTPELHALRLAHLKVRMLRNLELERKTSLVVNRFTKPSELQIEEIEKVVGLPVYATFPSEYADVVQAARQAKPSTKLALSFSNFALKVLDRKATPTPKRSRFVERFALVPMRYGFRGEPV